MVEAGAQISALHGCRRLIHHRGCTAGQRERGGDAAQAEIEKAKENDPIKLALENYKKNGLEFSEVEKIKNDAIFEVDEAFKYAETQPWPDPEDALEEVYVNYPRESL